MQAARQQAEAAQLLPALATTQQAADIQRAQAMVSGGSLQQAQAQRELDAQYAAFLAQQQAPTQALNVLLAAAGGIPAPATTISEQPSQSGSALLQGVGALGLGLGGVGSLFTALRGS